MMNHPIEVSVKARYLAEDSDPTKSRYAFGYDIAVKNTGERPVQLLQRKWIVRNSINRSFEIHGEGVLGDKPMIMAGETYHYSSGVVLDTPYGSMEGSYQFQVGNEPRFLVSVPLFTLILPSMLH